MHSASTEVETAIRSARSSFFLDGVDAVAYKLPHPPLPLPVILVVHRAVTRAFELLRARDSAVLAYMEEDRVTIALCAVLENDLRQSGEVEGFNRETFESVSRQYRTTDYSGTKVKKEPDMRFSIRDDTRVGVLSSEDGLVVECKPVDRKHPVGAHYCERGIQRFVIGDYAWAMQEALMLAYVRDGRTIMGNLVPAMRNEKQQAMLKTTSLPRRVAASGCVNEGRESLHRSVHDRDFSWREGKGGATSILIYHSWHACA